VTGPAVLAAYAVAATFLAPPALGKGWATRAPRLAIGLWLALLASWVVAVAVAGLALAVPTALNWPRPPLSAPQGLLASHGAPGGMPVAAAGLLLAAAVILRGCVFLVSGLVRAQRERHAHAFMLEVAGRPDPTLDAIILDHDSPAAYCLPCGRHRVVVSTATLALLGPAQLHAVLAHERAHLRGRHHVTVAVATALARAFPWLPLFAEAGTQLPALAEMAADDVAARRHAPGDLAAALVILAHAGTQSAALTAGGPAAIIRIQRLLAPPSRPGLPVRAARLATGAAALTFPIVIACIPLLIAACSVTS
jgi:Zn-dependent protease with chaperone function